MLVIYSNRCFLLQIFISNEMFIRFSEYKIGVFFHSTKKKRNLMQITIWRGKITTKFITFNLIDWICSAKAHYMNFERFLLGNMKRMIWSWIDVLRVWIALDRCHWLAEEIICHNENVKKNDLAARHVIINMKWTVIIEVHRFSQFHREPT